MIYGTYLSAAGMANEQANQNLIANNLANVETNGFRRQMALFRERRPEEPGGGDLDATRPPGGLGLDELSHVTGGRWMLPTHLDTTQGSLEQTGSPLDLALVGDGFLRVEHDGKAFLTRDGRLALDRAGTLTLAADPRSKILGDDGRPVVLKNVTADRLEVDDRGGVRDRDTGLTLAKLAVAVADNPRPVGGGRFAFTGTPRPAPDTEVRAGYVEGSNVDPTVELARMIESGRLLEANAKMIQYQDTSLGKLLEAGSIG